MSTPLDQIAVEDFAELVGSSLPASVSGQSFEFRVESAQPSAHPGGRSPPGFSLCLRGPEGFRLGQGTYALEHPRHGQLEVFMTPIRAEAGALVYEAIFN